MVAVSQAAGAVVASLEAGALPTAAVGAVVEVLAAEARDAAWAEEDQCHMNPRIVDVHLGGGHIVHRIPIIHQ